MKTLSKMKCMTYEGIGSKLSKKEIKSNLKEIKEWKLNKNKIEKSFKFENFNQALKFTDKIGKIAEKQGHHPDILLSWGKVIVSYYTHALKGLTINDFIMASKTDKSYNHK